MYSDFRESERRKRRVASGLTWSFAIGYLVLLATPVALHVLRPDTFNGDVTLLLFAYIAATYGFVSIVLATKTSFDSSRNVRQNDLALRMLERQIELAERSAELAARSLDANERSRDLGERSIALAARSVELGERAIALQEASAHQPQRPAAPMTISLFGPRTKPG